MTSIRAVVVSALIVFAVPAARADVWCSGSVLETLVYKDGGLMIRSSWRNDWTYICSMQSPWNGVATEACFSWYALVSSAKIHNKQIMALYVGESSCASIPTYGSSPAPVYVRMTE